MPSCRLKRIPWRKLGTVAFPPAIVYGLTMWLSAIVAVAIARGQTAALEASSTARD